MKKRWFWLAVLSFSLSSSAFAQTTSAPTPSTPAAPSTTNNDTTVTTTTTAATAEAKKDEPPRFYGFGMDFTIADSSGLNAVGQNYANDLNFYFFPEWKIGQQWLRNSRFKSLTLAGRLIVTQNLSGVNETNFNGVVNSDGPQGTCGNPQTTNGVLDPTTVSYCNPKANNRRADVSDIWLTLSNRAIYTIPKIGVALNPSFRIVLPTSAQSRFATLITGLNFGLGISRAFWKERITLSYGFSFQKNIHRYTSKAYEASGGQVTQQPNGNPYDPSVGATYSGYFHGDPGTNANFQLSHSLNAGFKLHEKWKLNVLYLVFNRQTYGRGSCIDNIAGVGPVDTCATGDAVASTVGAMLARPAWKDEQVLWITLNYQPLEWLGIYVAYITWAPLMSTDGSHYRQAIISTDYNAFTSVELGLSFSLEGIAAKFIKPRTAPKMAKVIQ